MSVSDPFTSLVTSLFHLHANCFFIRLGVRTENTFRSCCLIPQFNCYRTCALFILHGSEFWILGSLELQLLMELSAAFFCLATHLRLIGHRWAATAGMAARIFCNGFMEKAKCCTRKLTLSAIDALHQL